MEILVAFNILGFKGYTPLHHLLPFVAVLLVLFTLTVAWAVRDAHRNGLPELFAGLVVALTGWPFSIIWWITYRSLSKNHAPAYRLGQRLAYGLISFLFFFNLVFLWNIAWRDGPVAIAITSKPSLEAALASRDLAPKIRYLQLAADAGSQLAQSTLGLGYFEGLGVPRDTHEAEKWFRKIERTGDSKTMFYLGRFFETGDQGVTKNTDMAIRWYLGAANKGLKEAMFNLGGLYYAGESVPQDFSKALMWYRNAAEEGFVNATLMVGLMYALGQGVDFDNDMAEQWFRKAIQQDTENHKSYYFLARILHAEEEYSEALTIARKAIELNPNDVDNQKVLGDIQLSLTFYGDDTCPDFSALDAAIKTYRDVIKSGNGDAELHWSLSMAYLKRGNFDLALTEAENAYQLDKSENSYHWRLFLIAFYQGDMSSALKQLDMLESLDITEGVGHAEVQYRMGLAQMGNGNYETALQAFEAAQGALDDEISGTRKFYILLKEYFILKQVGDAENANSKLEQMQLAATTPWETQLAKFYNKKLGADELVQGAATDCMRCEAFFYIGRQHQIDGDMTSAKRFFQRAADMRAFTYYEHALAAAMIAGK